jgi:hypothetical protein
MRLAAAVKWHEVRELSQEKTGEFAGISPFFFWLRRS